jgi:hypothetical protein
MKVRTIGLGMVLGLALAAAPVIAQDPKGGGGAPGGGASERTGGGGAAANSGSGVSGGGSGGSVATGSSSSSSSSSSSGTSLASPTGAGAMASDLSIGARGIREERPSHRAGYSAASSVNTASDAEINDAQKATPRTASGSGGNASGGGSGEHAVPRGAAAGSASGNSNGGNTRARTPPPSSSENNSSGTREVPTWSRPRGDRPQTGTATDRVGPPPNDNHGYYGGRYDDPYAYYGGGYYSPYYSCGYAFYGCGYGAGYGYSYYPFAFGMGYGLYSGFGWNPYVGDPMEPYYAGSGGYSSGVYNTREQGNLKLKVKPRNAKVYVDGYFVGLVDQFDGAFQKLPLNGGRHKVEVRADGFETAEFDVLITPDQTVTFQGDLKRIQ